MSAMEQDDTIPGDEHGLEGDDSKEVTKTSRQPLKNQGRPRSEKARQAILDTTLKLLGERTLSELAIEEIASGAGVGKTTIYRWWPTKIALVLEAVELLPEMVAPDTGSLAEDLRGLYRQESELLFETPVGQVMAYFAADQSPQRDPAVRDFFERRLTSVFDMFGRAMERGELPAESDREELIYLALGPIVNRVFFATNPPDDAFIDLVVDTVLTGYPVALERRNAKA
ncbi:TetR/AcrR family transcriptional regulator [Dietzia sp. B32]|uniref:TetR/AcrR family transcriptional regulator n=1 Tax=Dietzia sp. B32 TaxID=2915130 RepID=UPI0021ADA4E1|nr:TetR/AcrR family transcriptional regulator [Dietzia sp. B32]UVE93814.1 TetR/AcrR family transcriptional regulator [Dietzia sp. B32]